MERIAQHWPNDAQGFYPSRGTHARESILRGRGNWATKADLALLMRGHFGARLTYSTTTRLHLVGYSSQFVEVDGDLMDIGPGSASMGGGVYCFSSDSLINAEGGETGSAPAASTLYYAYVSNSRAGIGVSSSSPISGLKPQGARLRLSATAPSFLFEYPQDVVYSLGPHNPAFIGIKYLGQTDRARCWRFVGWVYMTSGALFASSDTQRFVVSYYGRRPASLYTCPGYSDNDAQTTYTYTSTTWTPANAGTGALVEFISNGEDACDIWARQSAQGDSSSCAPLVGISTDSTTDCLRAGQDQVFTNGGMSNAQARYNATLGEGYHAVRYMQRVNSGTATVIVDSSRSGAVADTPISYLSGQVMI